MSILFPRVVTARVCCFCDLAKQGCADGGIKPKKPKARKWDGRIASNRQHSFPQMWCRFCGYSIVTRQYLMFWPHVPTICLTVMITFFFSKISHNTLVMSSKPIMQGVFSCWNLFLLVKPRPPGFVQLVDNNQVSQQLERAEHTSILVYGSCYVFYQTAFAPPLHTHMNAHILF